VGQIRGKKTQWLEQIIWKYCISVWR